MGQSKVIGCFCQQAAGVAKNTDRTPFAGENQIAVAVAIQITPHCAIDQTDPAEASRVFDVFDKSAFDLAEDHRASSNGVSSRLGLTTGKKIEFAIAVKVGRGE